MSRVQLSTGAALARRDEITTSAALLLHADDNVVVCIRQVTAGEEISVSGAESVVALENVAIGHKIARRALASGTKVIKYGLPIGSTTSQVKAGAWIHLHNMKSDYLDAHTRAATGAKP
jgi:hypothetical protein